MLILNYFYVFLKLKKCVYISFIFIIIVIAHVFKIIDLNFFIHLLNKVFSWFD